MVQVCSFLPAPITPEKRLHETGMDPRVHVSVTSSERQVALNVYLAQVGRYVL